MESDQHLTIKKLIEWQAFDCGEVIEEVSGQASGEASLETMLKRVRDDEEMIRSLIDLLQVEDSWKSLEYIVLPHRDSKDVFILGGADDVQVSFHLIFIYS